MIARYFRPLAGLFFVSTIVACTATAETIPGSPSSTNGPGSAAGGGDDDESVDGGSSRNDDDDKGGGST